MTDKALKQYIYEKYKLKVKRVGFGGPYYTLSWDGYIWHMTSSPDNYASVLENRLFPKLSDLVDALEMAEMEKKKAEITAFMKMPNFSDLEKKMAEFGQSIAALKEELVPDNLSSQLPNKAKQAFKDMLKSGKIKFDEAFRPECEGEEHGDGQCVVDPKKVLEKLQSLPEKKWSVRFYRDGGSFDLVLPYYRYFFRIKNIKTGTYFPYALERSYEGE